MNDFFLIIRHIYVYISTISVVDHFVCYIHLGYSIMIIIKITTVIIVKMMIMRNDNMSLSISESIKIIKNIRYYIDYNNYKNM